MKGISELLGPSGVRWSRLQVHSGTFQLGDLWELCFFSAKAQLAMNLSGLYKVALSLQPDCAGRMRF